MPPLHRTTLLALIFLSIEATVASEANPRFVFDSAPQPGLPAEAIKAQRSTAFAQAPVSKVVHENADRVIVRYFAPMVFRDTAQVERYLGGLLALRSGLTTRIVHWAEELGIPSIEATVWISQSNGRARLLLWPGRAAYQDSQGIWWFTSWKQEEEYLLLKR